MFTVRRLGASDRLARSLSCTNAVESIISVVGRLGGRVTNWRDPKMVRRWVGVGMLEAERSFRRIKGCKGMPALTVNIRAEVARRRADKATPGPIMPSRNGSVTAECAVCGSPLPQGRPRTTCSDGCRQKAWRLRHQPTQATPTLPAAQPPKAHTVYECPLCEARLLGSQFCEDCHTFILGAGGVSPCCGEPVTFDELLNA